MKSSMAAETVTPDGATTAWPPAVTELEAVGLQSYAIARRYGGARGL
jgi:hypothetical protein